MYCGKCGAEISDGSAFCSHCGAPATNTPPAESAATAVQPVQTARRQMSNWRRVLSIIFYAGLIIIGIVIYKYSITPHYQQNEAIEAAETFVKSKVVQRFEEIPSMESRVYTTTDDYAYIVVNFEVEKYKHSGSYLTAVQKYSYVVVKSTDELGADYDFQENFEMIQALWGLG